MDKRYKIKEGDWMAFLVMDTKESYVVCECKYEEDAEKICKCLNEQEEKQMTREQYEKLKEWVSLLVMGQSYRALLVEKELDDLMGFEK